MQLPVAIEFTSLDKGLYRSACFGHKNREAWESVVTEAKDACRLVYQVHFPEYPMRSLDEYDYNSCIFFGRDHRCRINATIRVCFDVDGTLPVKPFLCTEVRALLRRHRRMAVVGCHFSQGPYVKHNIRAIYQAAKFFQVDTYLIEARCEHKLHYERWFGAQEMDSRFASEGCVNLRWDIENTPPLFFRVFGSNQSHLNNLLAKVGRGE